MITSSREEAADFPKKQEPKNKSIPRATSSSSTTPWLKLKDPRIVRVSRAFGGKDRHSKVCTVRGLRDRRVRLSVPTAIQLYDLQERLGLNQPSKVVDWLLNAAKHEIDELPPLQMPPGGHFFGAQNFLHHEMGGGAAAAASQLEDYHPTGLERSNIWNSGTFLRSESKEVASRDHDQNGEKESWMTKRNDDDDGGGDDDDDDDNGEVGKHKKGGQIESTSSMSNFFPRPNNNSNQASSLQGLINGGMPPYGSSSYYQFESSNFGQLLLGNHPNVGSSSTNDSTSQTDHHHSHHHHHHQHQFHNFNVVPFQSTLSFPSGSHVLVCPPPPPTTTQSYVPSSSSPVQPDQQLLDPRQINYFHMLSTINQNKDT